MIYPVLVVSLIMCSVLVITSDSVGLEVTYIAVDNIVVGNDEEGMAEVVTGTSVETDKVMANNRVWKSYSFFTIAFHFMDMLVCTFIITRINSIYTVCCWESCTSCR